MKKCRYNPVITMLLIGCTNFSNGISFRNQSRFQPDYDEIQENYSQKSARQKQKSDLKDLLSRTGPESFDLPLNIKNYLPFLEHYTAPVIFSEEDYGNLPYSRYDSWQDNQNHEYANTTKEEGNKEMYNDLMKNSSHAEENYTLSEDYNSFKNFNPYVKTNSIRNEHLTTPRWINEEESEDTDSAKSSFDNTELKTITNLENYKETVLYLHNSMRKMKNLNSLKMNPEISKKSQSRAICLLLKPDSECSSYPQYSENITRGEDAADLDGNLKGAVTSWYRRTGATNDAYKNMLSPDIKEIGIGIAVKADNSWILLCNYSPAGNIKKPYKRHGF